MMAKYKKSNFYGILLAALMFVSIIALFVSEPKTTGFAVKEVESSDLSGLTGANNRDNTEINENNNIGNSCIGDIQHGSCSSTKPLYCNNGNLVYDCNRCGCSENFYCTEFGTCAALERCADGSIYGECAFLNGKFCDNGNLVSDCSLCGCDEGYACSDNKCVRE